MSEIDAMGTVYGPDFRYEPARPNWLIDIGRLLRGELSAIEAYDQVIEKYHSDPIAKRLKDFRNEHRRVAKFWRDEIVHNGSWPDEDSGPWGQVVFSVVGAAKLFGEASAIQALKSGEGHGLSEYKALLVRDDVPKRIKKILREDFIPLQERHIASLEVIQQII
ncbi:DUF2383 domain-containing protein [bacterium]|nr:DUF2383 domain-containing protein [bacterium]